MAYLPFLGNDEVIAVKSRSAVSTFTAPKGDIALIELGKRAQAALAAVNVNGGFSAALPHVQKLREIYTQMLDVQKKLPFTQSVFNTVANYVHAVWPKLAIAYKNDAGIHQNIINNLLNSNDPKVLATGLAKYEGWFKHVQGGATRYASVTSQPVYQTARAGILAAIAKLRAKAGASAGIAQRRQMTLEDLMPQLIDALGLDMSADANIIIQTWQADYQSDPKDVQKYKERLASLGIALNAPFADQVEPMIGFIKSKKMGKILKIVIPVGIVAAGAAALTMG